MRVSGVKVFQLTGRFLCICISTDQLSWVINSPVRRQIAGTHYERCQVCPGELSCYCLNLRLEPLHCVLLSKHKMFMLWSTCESSGMISSTRVLGNLLLLLLVLPPLPSFVSRWFPRLNCLNMDIGYWSKLSKCFTLGHDNLQDFPHFLSWNQALNDWNHLLPYLVLYPLHMRQHVFVTKLVARELGIQKGNEKVNENGNEKGNV